MNKIIEILLNYVVAPILGILFVIGIFFKNFFSAVMKIVYKRMVEFVAFIIFILIILFIFKFFN